MPVYFVKKGNKLYKFKSFWDVENFTGKDRRLYHTLKKLNVRVRQKG